MCMYIISIYLFHSIYLYVYLTCVYVCIFYKNIFFTRIYIFHACLFILTNLFINLEYFYCVCVYSDLYFC